MAIHHLVSRGIEVAQQHGGKDGWQRVHEIPGPALALVFATVAGYLMLHMAVSYTYGLLVPILVMTEAPATTTVIKTTEYRDEVEDEENPDAPLLTKEEKESQKPRDEEVLVITHKPVTARFCSVVRHLREKTGSRLSRFRGVGGFIVCNMIASVVTGFTSGIIPRGLGILQAPVIASLCLFYAAWIQQVVAMPGKNYFQRVAELRKNGGFKKLFLPFLLVEIVEYSAMTLPGNIMIIANSLSANSEKHETVITSVVVAVAVFIALFSFTCAVIPLHIALIRFQASFLPAETETVISIDRSLGDAEVKNIGAAWKSFPRGGVWRLIKTYVKVFIMQFTLALVAMTAVAIELKVFARPQFDGAVNSAREHYRI